MLKMVPGEPIFQSVARIGSVQNRFYNSYEHLVAAAPGTRAVYDSVFWNELLLDLNNIALFAQEAKLNAAESLIRHAKQLIDAIVSAGGTVGQDQASSLQRALEMSVVTLSVSLSAVNIFVLSGSGADYLNNPEPFGREVADAFPSAAYDIRESSACLGLERWTACVMHSMKVLETGLKVLCAKYQIDQNDNWNKLLNDLEAKLRTIDKKGHGASDAQWAAEAGTHLRFLKNAIRNDAMHPNKVFDERQTNEIYAGTRSFIQHLSTGLAE